MYGYDKPKNTPYYETADLGNRFIALIIDGFILALITGILVGATNTFAGSIGSFIVGVGYHWYFLTQQNGQTPGKRLMGIRVIKNTGAPLTFADVLVRYIGYIVNSFIFGLGWIWPLFDAQRRGWHDMMAGTIVVRA